MPDRIFETYAPTYWQQGLPVIPLRQRDKMPDIKQWSLYSRQMPTEMEQAHWLASYPKGNIGLPLGPCSGVCIIDIDTEDAVLDAAIREICGPTPWVRVGKKGAALAYRFEAQKNFKLRAADGGMICEFLGLGNQVVLPPSIHPDCASCGTKHVAGPQGVSTCCGTPNIIYGATADLWTVKDELPLLGGGIEDNLRALLDQRGFKLGAGGRSSPLDVVPAGERNIQMVRHAGYLARVVLGIDRSAKFSLTEAMDQMYHWVETYTAKISGDAMDPEKGVAKLLEFLMKDCARGKVMPAGWDVGLTDDLRSHPTIAALIEIQSAQRWDLGRMIHGLTAAVGDRGNDREHVERMIRNIVVSAAQDPLCEEYDVRCLHERIGQTYPELKMKWATLKQLFRENRGGLTAGEELTDHHAVAVAVLEHLKRDGEIRFDQSKFWQWNGSRWQVLEDDDLHVFIAENVKGCSLARREGDYAAIVRLLRKVCSSRLNVHGIGGVNFANGFYSEDGELVPHHPDLGCTYTFPFDYEPEAASQCPEWLNFLSNRWGHEPDFEERVLALQEAFAATLFGSATKYQRAFLLFGKGRSGKSQILNILQALLPEDAAACLGPERWGERFPLTHLIGKVANICNELPEQGKINGAMFKQVVDGATVFTEPKNVDGFPFSPICAHWFASNFLPWSQDTTDGFARRWLIWDFNRPVDMGAVETDIASRIVAQERHAIAAWAIEGHARLREQGGFTEPGCHERRINEMRRGNNSVLAFLQDSRAIVHGEGSMRLEDLHALYKTHQEAAVGGSKVLIDRFRNMVEELGFEVEVGHDGLGYPITTVHGLTLAAPRGVKAVA